MNHRKSVDEFSVTEKQLEKDSAKELLLGRDERKSDEAQVTKTVVDELKTLVQDRKEILSRIQDQDRKLAQQDQQLSAIAESRAILTEEIRQNHAAIEENHYECERIGEAIRETQNEIDAYLKGRGSPMNNGITDKVCAIVSGVFIIIAVTSIIVVAVHQYA